MVQWSGLLCFAREPLPLLGELGSCCHNQEGLQAPPTTHRAHHKPRVCVWWGVSLQTKLGAVCVSVCGWGCLQTVLAALWAVQPCPLLGPWVGRSAPGMRPLKVLLVPQVNLTPLGLIAQAFSRKVQGTDWVFAKSSVLHLKKSMSVMLTHLHFFTSP